MKAGPELDALVAEKVMGWKACGDVECSGCKSTVMLTSEGWMIRHPKTYQLGWSPSTDIAAAWEVVEEMTPPEMPFFELQKVPGRYKAAFDGEVFVAADTAPIAICLAGLKAVGVEVE